MAGLIDIAAGAQVAASAVESLFRSTTFGTLGVVEFSILASPETFDAERLHNFAVHDVVGGFARQQWVGDALETLDLTFGFHVSFTDPALQVSLLRQLANTHEPQALVLNNGIYRGEYVVTSIRESLRHTLGDGTVIASRVSLSLREWAAETAEELAKRRQSVSTAGANARRVLGLSLRDVALAARTIALNVAQHAVEDNLGQSLFVAAPIGVPVPGFPFADISNPSSPNYISPGEASRRG